MTNKICFNNTLDLFPLKLSIAKSAQYQSQAGISLTWLTAMSKLVTVCTMTYIEC